MSDINFDALLTPDQVTNIERKFQDDSEGIARRVTLMTLTKSKTELTDGLASMDSEAADHWLDQIEHFQSQLASLKEMADAALARLIVASGVAAEQP